jgi:hypothetical protein
LDIEAAFGELQQTVNAPIESVKEARRRRDLFQDAFAGDEDVTHTLPSGSLARGSQKDPIHDVDLIIVFDPDFHPTWGQPGTSAGEALEHTQKRVNELLGATNGTFAQEVRLAWTRNHSVKCWLDDPEDEDAFTVDVTPALRIGPEKLLIPEKDSSKWVETAPEYLIRVVAERHEEYRRIVDRSFVGLIRVIKRWGADKDTDMKGLLLEVLALNHLPVDTRPKALARFFSAATNAVLLPVVDPAGLCGEIQPDLDRQVASEHFARAAEAAWRAVEAQEAGETDRAACLWREVFGDIFPAPTGGCDNVNGKTPVGAGAGAAAGISAIPRRPRPVRDAPQG